MAYDQRQAIESPSGGSSTGEKPEVVREAVEFGLREKKIKRREINMTQKYKLNPDARKFFDEHLQREVQTKDWWEKQVIPIQLLEEVPNVYIEYGRKISEYSTSLKEWQTDGKRAKFEFTISVNDISYADYNKVSIPFLMDKIQSVVNDYFKN